MSLVWDHAHWIPGKILPQFEPSHLSVAHRNAKLEIVDEFEQVQEVICNLTCVGHVSCV